MKLTKMSLVAGLLLGANLYAIDNVKVSGNTQLFYGTQSEDLSGDATLNGGLFEQGSSYADVGLNIGVTADLTENVSSGLVVQAVSTLGLENSIVSGVWSGAHSTTGTAVDDALWVAEAWVEGKTGNTTGKLGRQTLDTPLAFTETWGVGYNTFESLMVTNEDIPDTTLVGAWIGKDNGYAFDTKQADNISSINAVDGKFNTFAEKGAYVLGVTNNSIAPLAAQAWYYEMPSYAKAYWLQADLDMEGFIAGAQYTNISYSETGNKDNTAYAAKLGYAIKDVVTITAAYSSVDEDAAGNSDSSANGVVNFATNGQGAGAASSLYTEFWWWFNTASLPGADTMALSFEGTAADIDLYLGLFSSEIEVAGAKDEVDEITFTASKSFGPLDTSLALIHDMFDTNGVKGADYVEDLTTVQVYLTYNF